MATEHSRLLLRPPRQLHQQSRWQTLTATGNWTWRCPATLMVQSPFSWATAMARSRRSANVVAHLHNRLTRSVYGWRILMAMASWTWLCQPSTQKTIPWLVTPRFCSATGMEHSRPLTLPLSCLTNPYRLRWATSIMTVNLIWQLPVSHITMFRCFCRHRLGRLLISRFRYLAHQLPCSLEAQQPTACSFPR